MTGMPDEVNVLHTSVLANDDELVIRYEGKGIAVGARLAIDLEEYHVIAVASTTPESTVTVIPAFNGSTPAAHNAGALIRVNPKFSDWRILRAMNQCIKTLHGEGLYRIRSTDFSYLPAQAGYNLDIDDMVSIWRVRFNTPGPEKRWPVLTQQDYYIDQQPDSVEFPGGQQLVLRTPGYPGYTVRVSYRARFGGPLVAVTDDIETVTGLPESSHEIPALGAAYRLLAGRDIKRSFLDSQPEPRRSDEVPPGAARNAMLPILELFYRAVDREISLLNRRFPQQT